MLFAVKKNNSGEGWIIVPTSGRFEGAVVATAEGVNMKGVKTVGKTLVGTLKAMWGATLNEDVYPDMETLRSLCLGRSFNMSPQERLWFDYDGLHDSVNHVVRSVDMVVLFGDNIFGKGVI